MPASQAARRRRNGRNRGRDLAEPVGSPRHGGCSSGEHPARGDPTPMQIRDNVVPFRRPVRRRPAGATGARRLRRLRVRRLLRRDDRRRRPAAALPEPARAPLAPLPGRARGAAPGGRPRVPAPGDHLRRLPGRTRHGAAVSVRPRPAHPAPLGVGARRAGPRPAGDRAQLLPAGRLRAAADPARPEAAAVARPLLPPLPARGDGGEAYRGASTCTSAGIDLVRDSRTR